MIGQIKGVLTYKKPPELIVDVLGVGYELYASMNTFYKLPDIGKEVTLFTHLIVREDVHLLYGFYEAREKTLFRELIKVNGVGPKMAITILSSIDPDAFVNCVMGDDIETLVKMQGVGKKTAERLIVEMKDRISSWHKGASNIKQAGSGFSSNNQVLQEVISALVALGYKPQEASRISSKIFEEGLTSEELIRKALRSCSK